MEIKIKCANCGDFLKLKKEIMTFEECGQSFDFRVVCINCNHASKVSLTCSENSLIEELSYTDKKGVVWKAGDRGVASKGWFFGLKKGFLEVLNHAGVLKILWWSHAFEEPHFATIDTLDEWECEKIEPAPKRSNNG